MMFTVFLTAREDHTKAHILQLDFFPAPHNLHQSNKQNILIDKENSSVIAPTDTSTTKPFIPSSFETQKALRHHPRGHHDTSQQTQQALHG
jgi:hypothetical protein